MAGTLMAWEEEWGVGESCFFLPLSKPSLISFQASVFLFNTKCWNRLRSVLGKKMVFLVYRFGSCFIVPFRELVCWGQLLFALPDMVHPSPQASLHGNTKARTKKMVQLKC